jgi:hypothetical protein
MNQLEQFADTMTEIANAFSFSDIQLDELEKYYKLELQNVDAFNKKRINTILFLNNYSDETAIMLEFAKLYVQLQQVRIRTNNTNVGFLIESSPKPRVYTTLETLVEYLVNYHNTFTDTKVLLYRIKQIQPIELI